MADLQKIQKKSKKSKCAFSDPSKIIEQYSVVGHKKAEDPEAPVKRKKNARFILKEDEVKPKKSEPAPNVEMDSWPALGATHAMPTSSWPALGAEGNSSNNPYDNDYVNDNYNNQEYDDDSDSSLESVEANPAEYGIFYDDGYDYNQHTKCLGRFELGPLCQYEVAGKNKSQKQRKQAKKAKTEVVVVQEEDEEEFDAEFDADDVVCKMDDVDSDFNTDSDADMDDLDKMIQDGGGMLEEGSADENEGVFDNPDFPPLDNRTQSKKSLKRAARKERKAAEAAMPAYDDSFFDNVGGNVSDEEQSQNQQPLDWEPLLDDSDGDSLNGEGFIRGDDLPEGEGWTYDQVPSRHRRKEDLITGDELNGVFDAGQQTTKRWILERLSEEESGNESDSSSGSPAPDPRRPQYDATNRPPTTRRPGPKVLDTAQLFPRKQRLTVKDLKQHDALMGANAGAGPDDAASRMSRMSLASIQSMRTFDETREEKRMRKMETRIMQAGRRQEKKANKIAQKEAAAEQIKVAQNAKHCRFVSVL